LAESAVWPEKPASGRPEGNDMPRLGFWTITLMAAAAAGMSLQRARQKRRARASGSVEFLAELLALNQSLLLVSSCVPAATGSTAVAELARRMSQDHAWLGRALKRASGLRAPTGMEDEEARQLVERIGERLGVAGDRAYIEYLAAMHLRATGLCERRLREEHKAVSRVARDALALLSEHKPLIERALADLADAPSGPAPLRSHATPGNPAGAPFGSRPLGKPHA
jgi:hypothetical protein